MHIGYTALALSVLAWPTFAKTGHTELSTSTTTPSVAAENTAQDAATQFADAKQLLHQNSSMTELQQGLKGLERAAGPRYLNLLIFMKRVVM